MINIIISIVSAILKPLWSIVKRYPWLIIVLGMSLYILYLHQQIEQKSNAMMNTINKLNVTITEQNGIYSRYVDKANNINLEMKNINDDLANKLAELAKIIKKRDETIVKSTSIEIPKKQYVDSTNMIIIAESIDNKVRIKFSRDFSDLSVSGYTSYPPPMASITIIRNPILLRLIETEKNNIRKIYITGSPMDSTIIFKSIETPSESTHLSFRERFYINLSLKHIFNDKTLRTEICSGFRIWRINPEAGISTFDGTAFSPFVGIRLRLL